MLTSGAGALAEGSGTVAVEEGVCSSHITRQDGTRPHGNILTSAPHPAVVGEVALGGGGEYKRQRSDSHTATHTTAYSVIRALPVNCNSWGA